MTREPLSRRIAYLGEGAASIQTRGRSLHTVLVPGASLGGPKELTKHVTAALINIERRGLHTVLLADTTMDLSTNVATVCRYVYTSEPDIAELARKMWGSELVLIGPNQHPHSIRMTLKQLPIPSSRTWKRRVYNAFKRR